MLDRRRLGGLGHDALVIDCPVNQVVARVIRDLNKYAQVRQIGQHFGHPRRERRVIEQCARSGICQQVLQFALDIAVVDVERSDARREAAEQRLDEFVPVVGVQAEQILARFMTGQVGALGVAAQPRECR